MVPEDRLALCRSAAGGFGIAPGFDGEPEPTALATIALDDAEGRRWLESSQDPDGGTVLRAGVVVRDLTALAALALPDGPAREKALDHLGSSRAAFVAGGEDVPHDPSALGWPWTSDTFGWVEPTAWAMLALRKHRNDSPWIADGLALLADRECSGGGWNYGNPVVFGIDLPAFGQTTAVALLALQGLDDPMVPRGLAALRALMDTESVGPLTASTAAVAFRLHGDPAWHDLARRVPSQIDEGLVSDAIGLAWAVLATGPSDRLEALVV